MDLRRQVLPIGEPDPRVVWAAERTALAWMRTGLSLVAFGFVLARAPMMFASVGSDPRAAALLPPIGLTLLGAGAVASVNAAIRHQRTLKKLQRGEPVVHSASFALIVGTAIAAAAVALVAWSLIS